MNKSDKDYFDLDYELEKILLNNGMIDDLFLLKDLQQRKLFLTSNINEFSIRDISKNIMQYNAEDKGKSVESRKPILLYISSNGGEVDAGFELIDIISTSITPVFTINLSAEYSMAFLIGLAGHKRYAFPNSKFLIHDGTSCIVNSGYKAQDQMEFNIKVEDRIEEFILSNSGITAEMYKNNKRIEWYMFAGEALELGCIDKIVTPENLDEII